MTLSCLKTPMLVLALAGAAPAADRVVIQGRRQPATTRALTWTLLQEGVLSRLGNADGFKVPEGRRLVITEAAFTVRGGATRLARAATFRISVKDAQASQDLAEISARLMPQLAANTVSKVFSPGLPVAGGSEVRGALAELQPPGNHVQVDVTFYGLLE
jgi:hypothetical protein